MENQTRTMGGVHLVTRLRYDSALHGLQGQTVPTVEVKYGTAIMCGIGSRAAGPRFAFAHGRSIPISRGSPPIFNDDR
jgi:hypothetical protein